ncbi:hypothetical protein MRB53_037790 [Persea americana]|nr:hypothetical protein MRB53_037790 [Persea americana]
MYEVKMLRPSNACSRGRLSNHNLDAILSWSVANAEPSCTQRAKERFYPCSVIFAKHFKRPLSPHLDEKSLHLSQLASTTPPLRPQRVVLGGRQRTGLSAKQISHPTSTSFTFARFDKPSPHSSPSMHLQLPSSQRTNTLRLRASPQPSTAARALDLLPQCHVQLSFRKDLSRASSPAHPVSRAQIGPRRASSLNLESSAVMSVTSSFGTSVVQDEHRSHISTPDDRDFPSWITPRFRKTSETPSFIARRESQRPYMVAVTGPFNSIDKIKHFIGSDDVPELERAWTIPKGSGDEYGWDGDMREIKICPLPYHEFNLAHEALNARGHCWEYRAVILGGERRVVWTWKEREA